MPPLSALQADFRRAIVSGDSRAAAAAVCAQGLEPAARLRVHAHHYATTLTEALAANYPVVARLVGERCFAGLTREFIQIAPPSSPCLFAYGRGFARYLAAVPTLMELPYLPDVARLEWALSQARHAADGPRLPAEALALLQDSGFSAVVFTLYPATRLVASLYPVDSIWRANQPGADPKALVSLTDGARRLLIHRDDDDDVAWCALASGEFAFVEALAEGLPLGKAWNRASAADPRFDGGRTLAGLITVGVLADFRFPATLS